MTTITASLVRLDENHDYLDITLFDLSGTNLGTFEVERRMGPEFYGQEK